MYGTTSFYDNHTAYLCLQYDPDVKKEVFADTAFNS
jgi:hypothetical protein